MSRSRVAAVTLISLLALAPRAHAASATANIAVTATVITSCAVTSGSVAFGNYDPTSTSTVTQTGSFQVACTKGTTATVGLDLGAHASGSARRMTNGSEFLTYELYKDSNRSTVWGTSGGALLTLNTTTNAAQPLTIYGSVAGSQDVVTGSYSDTVVATVTF